MTGRRRGPFAFLTTVGAAATALVALCAPAPALAQHHGGGAAPVLPPVGPAPDLPAGKAGSCAAFTDKGAMIEEVTVTPTGSGGYDYAGCSRRLRPAVKTRICKDKSAQAIQAYYLRIGTGAATRHQMSCRPKGGGSGGGDE